MPEANKETLTTGQSFGALYLELVAGGIPDEVAGQIVRDAAIQHIGEFGFAIQKESVNV